MRVHIIHKSGFIYGVYTDLAKASKKRLLVEKNRELDGYTGLEVFVQLSTNEVEE